MLRKLLFSIAIVLSANALILAQSSGTLKGKMVDKETKEAIPFANIVIESGGRQLGGTTSDFDGNYTIKPIPPGKYDVVATYVGYNKYKVEGVVISPDKITFLDVEMSSSMVGLETVEIVSYKVPLIEKDGGSSGATLTSEEISKMAGRSAESVAITVGGVFSDADGNMGGIRGARSDGTVTYVDGVRVGNGTNVPQAAIDQVSVITGGTPANYGDATGGIVNIVTKGPSKDFGGGVEYTTSQFLDKFGHHLGAFNLHGPLWVKKDSTHETAIMGYFLSVEYSYNKDNRPSHVGYYRVNDSKLKELEENPLRPSGTGFGTFRSSEFLRMDDIENIKARENGHSQNGSFNGKIDIKTSKTTNLTIGGSYDIGNGRVFSYSNSLLNSKNNQEYLNTEYRIFGRFTQRFLDNPESKSPIKNVYYQVQVDFTRSAGHQQHAEHKDNLFKYGYIGKFKTHTVRSFEQQDYTRNGVTYNDIWVHNGYRDTLFSFEASDLNPEMAAYTSQYYSFYNTVPGHYDNITSVQLNGGYVNGDYADNVYGLWRNTGFITGGYSKYKNDQIGFNASASADIGNHGLMFGFQYEQSTNRFYTCAATDLWPLMRQLTNFHIIQLDTTKVTFVEDANGVFQDTVYFDRLYSANEQTNFDKKMREKLGLAVNSTDWIDIDNYEPDEFSIDMFSADELLNSGSSIVSYAGYDHTGKVLKSRPSFEDFFSAKDDEGNFKREIGAYQPIYMAGFIQDKFAFKDLIFNIGLRVDRFDANQYVLKDKYSIFETKSAGEVTSLGAHPSTIEDDYVVYVNDFKNPTSIKGYRNGDTWYDVSGVEITDPMLIGVGSGTVPYLKDPSEQISINAYKDYEPKTNVMPRVSFSFPISDQANFFAHYDVLTKRPTTGEQFSPTDYLYMGATGEGSVLSNPDLKSEKTIDYEIGFQQALTKSSALKFSTYYREQRNMVQAIRVSGAYPRSYLTYGNIDFGTIKGFVLQYDLRQTGNLWLKATYTLQFAESTGSNANSGMNLVAAGQPNLRTLNPTEEDRRHSIAVVVDYRFDGGKNYNGPVIKGKNILEYTGLNFTLNGGSGTPYSKQSEPTGEASISGGGTTILQGTVNGARLPADFRADAKLNKEIYFKVGSRELAMDVYLQVLNVFDNKGIINVYRFTGNPDDDGYLTAAKYQTQIKAQLDEQSFRDLYSIKVNSPYNYSMPRRVRLGVMMSF